MMHEPVRRHIEGKTEAASQSQLYIKKLLLQQLFGMYESSIESVLTFIFQTLHVALICTMQ